MINRPQNLRNTGSTDSEFSKAESSFSIIVPTFNRPLQLDRCLDCLTDLDYTKSQYEVVVVDDGSSSSMEPVVEPYRQRMNISLIVQNNSGPGIARNTGVASSSGRFIAFTDDDCKPDRDWLASFFERFVENPDRMYGGHVHNALDANIYSSASQTLVDYLYTYYNSDRKRTQFYTSNNIAMARDIFDAVGGFDTNFPGACGEDREFCDRWQYCGYGLAYVPEAIVHHYHELTLRSFCRQHYNYGGGAIRFRTARARRNQERLKIEPLAFYLGLVLYPWKMKLPRPLSGSTLLTISQLANAVGFAGTSIRT